VWLACCAAFLAAATPSQTIFRILDEQIPASPPLGSILAAVDVDLDGEVDFVTANSVYLNDGNLGFTVGSATPYGAGANLAGERVGAGGDLNGDGFPDIVVGAGWWGAVWLNNGAGGFPTSIPLPTPPPNTLPPYPNLEAVVLGDVDQDGDLDVFVTYSGYGTWFFQGPMPVQPHLLLNNGAGVLTDVTTSRLPAFSPLANGADMQDFDGDGDLDILIWRSTGATPWGPTSPPATTLLLRNNGAGFFGAPIAVPDPGVPANVAVGDFNGDGYPDLAVANIYPGTVTILLNAADWNRP